MKPMNLLYIFADQWRAHGIGAAGEDPVLTPNMDAFAAESMSCTMQSAPILSVRLTGHRF